MIVQMKGDLVEKRVHSVILRVHGIDYEIWVPRSVAQRIDDTRDEHDQVSLVTYYYFQLSQSSGQPILIGFINEVERDFFLQFIKVSGIGPRAAVKALDKSIHEISKAIDIGDVGFLNTLPGIGRQRAKEIVAKLQGKIGKFGLIQDQTANVSQEPSLPDWRQEAMEVLEQLQYKRAEALAMIEKAVTANPALRSGEELLSEIYKQKIHQ